MNRVAISLSLIAIIIVFIVACSIYVNVSFNDFYQNLENAVDHAKQQQLLQAEKEFDEYLKKLEQHIGIYSLIAGFDTLNKVSHDSMIAQYLIDIENVSDFVTKGYEIMISLNHLKTTFNRVF